jgi:predicted adenine nucleotide alpha hydrolase (AANH) superfamily ATPase
MTSILLHACCGPCATYVVTALRERSFDVTAYWYNPNVHPFREHQLRLEAMQDFARASDLPLVVEDGYDMLEYFRAVAGHESERCADCYRMRLARTAEVACQKGIDAFTTTLLISPYQRLDLIREVGEGLARKHGVAFHYEDFTPGFRESHRISREMGLYHQGYCGCVYSEYERYGKVKI